MADNVASRMACMGLSGWQGDWQGGWQGGWQGSWGNQILRPVYGVYGGFVCGIKSVNCQAGWVAALPATFCSDTTHHTHIHTTHTHTYTHTHILSPHTTAASTNFHPSYFKHTNIFHRCTPLEIQNTGSVCMVGNGIISLIDYFRNCCKNWNR